MEEDSRYRMEASDERMTLFIIRRDGPVPMCELPDKWIRSLLKKGHIRRAGIPTFVEVTQEGDDYIGETM